MSNVEVIAEDSCDIVEIWSAKYKNIPYKEFGRDFYGSDCWGLIRLVLAHQYGIAVPSYLSCKEYTEDQMALIERAIKNWDNVWVTQQQPGDVVIFGNKDRLFGMGIMVGNKTMLTINSINQKAYIRELNNSDFTNLYGFFRYRNPLD